MKKIPLARNGKLFGMARSGFPVSIIAYHQGFFMAFNSKPGHVKSLKLHDYDDKFTLTIIDVSCMIFASMLIYVRFGYGTF